MQAARFILCGMKEPIVRGFGWTYRVVGTKIFFLFDSEPIHKFVLDLGEIMGKIPGIPQLVGGMLRIERDNLRTTVAGITFDAPIGLSAGFDHDAQLPFVVGSLGFGFESIGTVTLKSYKGNPLPQMKRLIKSRALLVNKGFKSSGIDVILAKLAGKTFPVPIGISIGRTNTTEHEGHEDAIADIKESFAKLKASNVPFSYYELNISCPNLLKDISFYPQDKFEMLLKAVDPATLGKPLFVKMPISLTDDETKALLDVAMRYKVSAVTVGNLLRDRTNPAFDPDEIKSMEQYKGNWGGIPAQKRSDELVKLAYTHTKGALPIIGVGGVFTAEDAYRKIRLGASLIQVATSAIFMGPQVGAEIAIGLSALLKRDGFAHLSDAVGVDA